MADIKQAIEYAKNNPDTPYATELRRRIESGQMDDELRASGVTIGSNQSVGKSNTPARDYAVGFTKGLLSSATETAALGQKLGQGIIAAVDPTRTYKDVVEQSGFNLLKGQKLEDIRNILKASNTPEKAGKLTEFIAEMLFPVGKVSKAVSTVDKSIATADRILNEARATGYTDAIVNKTKDILSTADNTIGKNVSRVRDAILSPDVSQATKVSLNPVEALKGTGQDIQVSVGGKIKNLSEITPEEAAKIKMSTEKSLDKFTKQAELFSKDRSVKGGSPVEIVGNRVDNALSFADKKRQVIGQKMGEIESKYISNALPIGKKTLDSFASTIKSFDNPKYGIDTAEAPIVRKLISDFDSLEKGGATIGERLNFVRSWDKYLNDAKDAFGNFKENATVNTRIQNAVKALKDETVDNIAAKDKTYRNLRKQYRTFKQLDDIGNSLLGKDGALGERIKGAATVKRAIQSNSDAGARQFLIKLKELTGYDAIKEGDIALTAMENVGDYQGLSLLNILKDGKKGLILKGLEKVQDKVIGDRTARIKRYIRK